MGAYKFAYIDCSRSNPPLAPPYKGREITAKGGPVRLVTYSIICYYLTHSDIVRFVYSD